jgi:hypothetical protein
MKLILLLHLLSVYTPFDFGVMTKFSQNRYYWRRCHEYSATALSVGHVRKLCYLIMVVPNICTVLVRSVPVLCEEVPVSNPYFSIFLYILATDLCLIFAIVLNRHWNMSVNTYHYAFEYKLIKRIIK